MSILEPNPLCRPDVAGHWASDEFNTGRRLGWEYSRKLRWCQDWNCWMVYSGGRWIRENKEQSRFIATAVCTAQINDNNGDGSRTASYIKNVLIQARQWLAITPQDFDNNPLLLCCKDGVVDLSREGCGVLLEHNPDYLLTLSTGRSLRQYCNEYGVIDMPSDWGYETSEWEMHLNYMTQNLEKDRAIEFKQFFWRWSGTCLIGSQNLKPHHFLNLTGQGRNGKGVAAEARIWALGDYGMIGPIRLVTRKQSDHSTELAGCEGKRLLVVEEVSMVQSAVVKDLTGGGTMTARRIRQDDVTFAKSWALELNSNQPLNLQGESTKAIRRRRIVAHLGDEIPGGLHRDGIIELLREEADLILCWMICGLRAWYEDGGRTFGLAIPQWMLDAGEEQADDDDVIGALIAEKFENREDGRILGSAFVAMVNERRKVSGFLPLTPAAIYSYLREAGYVVERMHANKTYVRGLRMAEVNFGDLAEIALN